MLMRRPKLNFLVTHNDPIIFTVLKKLIPILMQLDYEIFYAESTSNSLKDKLDDILGSIRTYKKLKKQFEEFKLDINNKTHQRYYVTLKLGSTSHAGFEESLAATEQLVIRHTAELAQLDFLLFLQECNLKFAGIDDEITKTNPYHTLGNEDVMKVRNKKMISTYLACTQPVMGTNGLGHCDGFQALILESLPLQVAKANFGFFYIYSQPPLDRDEEDIRLGKREYPLGLTCLDATKLSIDTIVAQIVNQVHEKSKLLESLGEAKLKPQPEAKASPLATGFFTKRVCYYVKTIDLDDKIKESIQSYKGTCIASAEDKEITVIQIDPAHLSKEVRQMFDAKFKLKRMLVNPPAEKIQETIRHFEQLKFTVEVLDAGKGLRVTCPIEQIDKVNQVAKSGMQSGLGLEPKRS